MKRKPKALSVIWEPVNDAHSRKKLRQALQIVLSEGDSAFPASFDEISNIQQYEGEAATELDADKGRISNAN